MPLYEYECGACGQRFELIRRHSDGPVDVCTLCGKGPVTRLFSSPAIQFKGSGFYITDYAKKGEGGKGEGTGGKSGKAAAEQKSDAKSDAAAADKGGSSEAKPAASSTSDASSTPAAAPAKPTASKD